MNEVALQTGFDTAALAALCERFQEPAWLRQKRERALARCEALNWPQTRYTQIRGLKLEDFSRRLDDLQAPEPEALPPLVRELLAQKGEADPYLLQLDALPLRAQLPPALREKGVIFCDLHTAAREHPELVQKHLLGELFKLQLLPEALHAAFWSGGVFVYVPEGVRVDLPLHALFLQRAAGAALSHHALIVAEAGSQVTYLEESYALDPQAPALHTGGTEVWVGPGAQVQVGSIQHWNEKTFSFITRRARVAREGKMDWTLGWLGGRLVLGHLSNELAGPGAQAHDVQMAFTQGKQHVDISSNLIHQVPDTRGEVRVRSVLRDRSRSVFSGLIRIEPGAQRSNAYQSQRALILNPGARNDASPSLEINANDVRCTHAASASQLDEEKLFYLRSRGLDAEQAKKAIVDGFFQPTVDNITLPLARERLERLIDEKWHRRQG